MKRGFLDRASLRDARSRDNAEDRVEAPVALPEVPPLAVDPPDYADWKPCQSSLEWHNRTLSDINLHAFNTWARIVGRTVAENVLEDAPIVNHNKPTPSGEWGRLLASAVPLGEQISFEDGTTAPLRAIPCTRPGCHRCSGLRGGYSWQWTDARWTPQLAILSPTDDPAERRRACLGTEWPRGVIRSTAGMETTHQGTAICVSYNKGKCDRGTNCYNAHVCNFPKCKKSHMRKDSHPTKP